MTRDSFKDFHSGPEIIRLAVMMYVRFPLSLRNVEDLLHECRIEICISNNNLYRREGSTPVAPAPPFAPAKAFSRSGCGRIFLLF